VSYIVTEFSALKSTQYLNLGVPSKHFLGTKMAGADQEDLLGLLILYRACFLLAISFFASGRRGFYIGVVYWVARRLLVSHVS
jgi:hypothetical protein